MMTAGEAIVLGVVALVVVGPRSLPRVLRGAGRLAGAGRVRFGDEGLKGIALIAFAIMLVAVTLVVRR
jgi:Sec-independent protein translocase protein TatA